MDSKKPNTSRNDLLRRALTAKGYRPTRAADIERFLDAMKAPPLDSEAAQRMLRKIRGEQEIFPSRVPAEATGVELSEEERELVAMYRANKRKDLPPDLAAKVKAMEERAMQRPPREEQGGG